MVAAATEISPTPAPTRDPVDLSVSSSADAHADRTSWIPSLSAETRAFFRKADHSRGGGHLSLWDVRVPLLFFGFVSVIATIMAAIVLSR